jgi:peptidoglycan/xylan/chitin deacetylase (PgdA/CDA1 family)
VWEALRRLPTDQQAELLRQISSWARMPLEARLSHRLLTRDEAHQLGKGDHSELGAHTVNHVALSWQPKSVQEQEIRSSRQGVRMIANRTVRHFAYPYGDYSAETVEMVRESGFSSAVTTNAGCVEHAEDRWRLPRVPVFDWDAEEFARRIEEVFRTK